MLIQGTKVLLDKLELSEEELQTVQKDRNYAEDFYSWHANLVTINRRKAIVCMNNLTKYTIVLYRPRAKDIASFEERFREAVRTAFCEEGIKEEVICAYLEGCGKIQFSKTAGRSLVASLNQICKQVEWYVGYLDEEAVIQDRISLKMGEYLLKFNGEYDYPSKRLFCELCKMMGKDEKVWDEILRVENYELMIRMDLAKFDIWRRILIPSRCTFHELHRVIQKTFGWFEYHLHEFSVMEDKAEEQVLPLYARTRKMCIADGENSEAEEYLEPEKYEIRNDTNTKLRDIFAKEKLCVYTYDFGDSWEHVITLERVEESTNRVPRLLEMKGERPPEDVGGEGGFEEYMRIISDENDPEYESMKQWSEITRAKEKTMEEINRDLRLMY